MLSNIHRMLFLDIETVPLVYQYSDLDEETRWLWDEKLRYSAEYSGNTTEALYEKAGVMAEFSKVICISTGFIHDLDGEPVLRLKSFCGHNEATILSEFSQMLDERFKGYTLCAHIGKEFDFPFVCGLLVVI